MTLEEAYRLGQQGRRVKITFTSDDWGWPSQGGPLNPVTGIVAKNSAKAKVRIYILLRQRNSLGGYQIDDDHIASIVPVEERRHLPRCVKCNWAIRAREYMNYGDGTYQHIVCPATPWLRRAG